MKKIDVNKSLIFSQNIEDFKNSLDYLYQDGYCSNSKDFSEYEEGNLDGVHASNFMFRPYELTQNGDNQFFSYFIPKSKVVFIEEEPKKKKLRPYKTLAEFPREIGSVLTYRSKLEPSVHILTCVESKAIQDNDLLFVCLGGLKFTPLVLLKDYEYLDATSATKHEWLPFGVEE